MLKKADRQLSKLGHAARKTRGIAPRGLSVLSSCLSTSLQTSASPCYTSLLELGAFAHVRAQSAIGWQFSWILLVFFVWCCLYVHSDPTICKSGWKTKQYPPPRTSSSSQICRGKAKFCQLARVLAFPSLFRPTPPKLTKFAVDKPTNHSRQLALREWLLQATFHKRKHYRNPLNCIRQDSFKSWTP